MFLDSFTLILSAYAGITLVSIAWLARQEIDDQSQN